eukprot:1813139-Pleurochrysis_carterae.AAC.1
MEVGLAASEGRHRAPSSMGGAPRKALSVPRGAVPRKRTMALFRRLTGLLRRAAWALEPVLRPMLRALATVRCAIGMRGRHFLNRLALLPAHPRFYVASSVHRQWLIPPLCKGGMDEAAKSESGLGFIWALRKQVLPDSEGALCFNSLPHLKHLDDKVNSSVPRSCISYVS